MFKLEITFNIQYVSRFYEKDKLSVIVTCIGRALRLVPPTLAADLTEQVTEVKSLSLKQQRLQVKQTVDLDTTAPGNPCNITVGHLQSWNPQEQVKVEGRQESRRKHCRQRGGESSDGEDNLQPNTLMTWYLGRTEPDRPVLHHQLQGQDVSDCHQNSALAFPGEEDEHAQKRDKVAYLYSTLQGRQPPGPPPPASLLA